MPLGRIWSRIVGLKGWNEEARLLHNIEGDDVPAPGETVVTQPLEGERRPGQRPPEAGSDAYDNWEGADPGH